MTLTIATETIATTTIPKTKPKSCKHNQKIPPRVSITVEIRHYTQKSFEHYLFLQSNPDEDCSVCFVENANKLQESHNNSLSRKYFDKAEVETINIPSVPCSYDELQYLLAIAIPRHYGPALVEYPNGNQIEPRSCSFKDGDRIIFREIRPSSKQDFDVQELYKRFDGISIEHFLSR